MASAVIDPIYLHSPDKQPADPVEALQSKSLAETIVLPGRRDLGTYS